MAALDYLKARDLYAEARRGGRLSVWPARNITPEVRAWIMQHKDQILLELRPKGLNAWRISVDGKAITMLTPCGAEKEVLESARARWPGSRVEVEH